VAVHKKERIIPELLRIIEEAKQGVTNLVLVETARSTKGVVGLSVNEGAASGAKGSNYDKQ
jgi:hypothetical protein